MTKLTKRMDTRLPEQLRGDIDDLARKYGCSPSEMTRLLIQHGISTLADAEQLIGKLVAKLR